VVVVAIAADRDSYPSVDTCPLDIASKREQQLGIEQKDRNERKLVVILNQ
jgi:hypothetical protein